VRPRAEPQSQEKTWRISVVANKRAERFGVEKETTCRKRRDCQPTMASNVAPLRRIHVGRDEIGAVCSMPLEGRVPLLAQARRSVLQRAHRQTCSTTKVPRTSHTAGGGRQSRLRPRPYRPARHQRAGFCEEGQPHPCRSTNGTAPRQAKTSRQKQGRHSNPRHRENHMIASDGGRDGDTAPIAVRKVVDRIIAKAA
jgi:hypothetical protein